MTTVKRGDTGLITLYIISDNVPVDLTGSTLRVLAKQQGSEYNALELDHAVVNPTEGRITHKLTGTLEPGYWNIEVEVTQDDRVITYPSDGYVQLYVQPDLG